MNFEKRKYTNIFFDLDGTIVDSYKGIIDSLLYAFKKMKVSSLNIDTLRKFIGPPLDESIKKYCGIDDESFVKDIILAFREYYNEVGVYDFALYKGIDKTIESLYSEKYNIFLATAKPEDSAFKILKHAKIDKYFTNIYGAVFNGNRSNKVDVLKYAVESGGFDTKKSIMIGDRIDDIIGAKSVSMDSIAVRYGFGEESEFMEATYIVDSPLPILKVIAPHL